MDAQFVCLPLYKEFEYLFSKICSTKVLLNYRFSISSFPLSIPACIK